MTFVKNILNHTLIVMLLVASTGVTMSKHYCMGRMKSLAFFEKAHDCAEIAGLEKGAMDPMGCCDDVTEEIKVKDFAKTAFNFEMPVVSIIGDITHYTAYFRRFEVYNPGFYTKYIPPLIHQNVRILIQNFLI